MRSILELVFRSIGLRSGDVAQADLVKADAVALRMMHKHLAEAIARKRDALGAHGLYEGRQPAHWRRVADLIAEHPLPPTGPEIRFG